MQADGASRILPHRHGFAAAINWNLAGEKDFYERLESVQKSIRDQVNKVVGKSSKIASVEIQQEPFKKTATMKIRRFLYRDNPNKK